MERAKMSSFDLIQVFLLGCGTGFGSAFGVEISKALIKKLQGFKLVKEVTKHD
jgi:hypothetical protein